jgi:phage baseplate assembly protein W
MAYIINGADLTNIDLAPTNEVEEILQNIATLLATPTLSVPLDRGLGLPQRFLDKPLSIAQNIIVSEVMDAIDIYEPRAEVVNVNFTGDGLTGKLIPIVEVEIRG